MPYHIEYKSGVKKDIRRVPPRELDRIVQKITALAENPRPAGYTKITGSSNLYRIRHGDYRIVYSIHDDRLVVLVVKIGHRREVYRG